jgi:hypothetical protein
MTLHGRSSRWAAALALGLAGLIGVGAATEPAAPARSAASAFELILDGNTTWDDAEVVKVQGTFRSGRPFCATGTLADPAILRGEPNTWRLTCDDGSGSLTVSMLPVSRGEYTTWRIFDGSGSYAGLRGRGRVQGETLESGPRGVTWRSTFRGVVDRDEVAPMIALSSATAKKLRRPAGAYALRLSIAVRDNVTDNEVSYTVRASGPGGRELARRFGTTRTETVSITLRIRPLAGKRTVRLLLNAEDPVGNAVWVVPRDLRLPR